MDCRKRTDEFAERMAGRFKQAPPNRGSFKQPPHPWHSRAGGGDVCSIKSAPTKVVAGGSLLISDDFAGALYRIWFDGEWLTKC
jgi:hypothetical protein